MDKFVIKKSFVFNGIVCIFGVKNVVLLLLMISLLIDFFCCYINVFCFCDINIMMVFLCELGVEVVLFVFNDIVIDVSML